MKIRTSDLIGAALDWAVAKYEGNHITFAPDGLPSGQWEMYSSNWSLAGPIIEREGIATREIPPVSGDNGCIVTRRWIAEMFRIPGGPRRSVAYGTTPLVAAMRCYVASKLGEVVEIPEEFAQGDHHDQEASFHRHS